MRETLEARVAAAEDMRKEAEEEKFEKEESARASLAEQEVIMEKVVQESKLLQQQAEENSKVATYTYMFIHLLEDKLFVTLSFYFVAVTGVSHGPWSRG